MPDGDPEDPRVILAQREIVQRELQRMERRMEAIEQAMMDAQRAAATVRGLSEAAGTVELLVPIGAGVHVPARANAATGLLMPVGAGYLTEGDPAKVLAALEARMKGIQESFEAAATEAERLGMAAAAIEERLSELSGDATGSAPQ